MNKVRLDYEARHPECTWISERSLLMEFARRDPGEEPPHVPDGEVWVSSDKAIAVEVELSPKEDQEIDAILSELFERYQTVWYFVTDANPVNVQAWRIVK